MTNDTESRPSANDIHNHQISVLWTEERKWGHTVPVGTFVDAVINRAENAYAAFAADKGFDVHDHMMDGFREHLHAILGDGVVTVDAANEVFAFDFSPISYALLTTVHLRGLENKLLSEIATLCRDTSARLVRSLSHDVGFGAVSEALAPEFTKLARLCEHAATDNLDGVAAEDFAKAAEYTQVECLDWMRDEVYGKDLLDSFTASYRRFVVMHARGPLKYFSSPSLKSEFAKLIEAFDDLSAMTAVNAGGSCTAPFRLAVFEIAAAFKLAFPDAVVRLDTVLKMNTLAC
ncbi:hypothetical protein H9P43_005620 [Blastocladiella emersonii ATCC 22665]|nr:hypothetical protein H9P43_005620 [Blastocladiella emersonii ATCC 22665]